MAADGRVVLLVGTKKGAFVIEPGAEGSSDGAEVRGPLCELWPIYDVSLDRASGAIYAGGGSPWYGPAVWRSDDLGRTWTHSSQGLDYGEGGPRMNMVWNVTPAHGALYAGVDPAGLFRSSDAGRTWDHVRGLTEHPTRPEWQPGAGGLCLHTIVAHPDDPDRMWVGISSVGAFETTDAGQTWETRNRGVRTEYGPERYPEFGQCVHKFAPAAGMPDRIYQQNHCGMYRTDDAGRTWHEISAGLPTDFGFPIVTHPRDPDTAYVIPLTGPEQGRYMPEGRAAVWGTSDAGATWTRLDRGLPQDHAYQTVLREAMAIDDHDPAGIWFGTENGELYGSRDEVQSWQLVAARLPPIWSVEAAVIRD